MPSVFNTASDETCGHDSLGTELGSGYIELNVELEVEKELHHFHSPVYKKVGML